MSYTRRARTATAVVVALLAGVLVSDVAGFPGCAGGCNTPTAAAAAPVRPAKPAPPVLGVSPFDGSTGINPLTTPVVDVLDGKITDVSLYDDWGNEIEGMLSEDRSSWAPAEQLNFARSYTLTVNSKSNSGVPLTRTSNFATLVPNNYVHPYIEVQGGFAPNENTRYGVGTVIVAHFDEAIANKALAEKHMIVRTDPPVQGSWNWLSDTVAHWRPQNYYQAGTRISVELNTFGLELGKGMYGQADAKANLTIGDAQIAVANDITKQVSVFANGRLVRTMPTSMGRGGTTTIGDKTFAWWTPPGIYNVLDKAQVVTMDSATYGVPAGSAVSYKREIGWATRISNDGIYLHHLPDTVWAQGNTNLSSGCLNLNGENAKWYYDMVQPGDIVEVRYTGGPPLTLVNGGDWSVPWEDWLAGSALSLKHASPPAPSAAAEALGAPGP